MADIKLIAMDLDGTLLDGESRMPERNRKAVAAAMARGVRATISTGRMYGSTRRFADLLELNMPFICYNGAMIIDREGEIFSHHPLDLSVAKRLLSLFKDRGTYVQSYVDDVLFVRDCSDEEFQNYTIRYGVPGISVGEELYTPCSSPTKLLAVVSDPELARATACEIEERFGGDVYVTFSNSDFVEMMNPAVNKGRSLKTLAHSMGIGMDEVLAIGDGENDAEMIGMAGVGVAMGNGSESTKAVADDIAPRNDENGVAWAIEKHVLSRFL